MGFPGPKLRAELPKTSRGMYPKRRQSVEDRRIFMLDRMLLAEAKTIGTRVRQRPRGPGSATSIHLHLRHGRGRRTALAAKARQPRGCHPWVTMIEFVTLRWRKPDSNRRSLPQPSRSLCR